MTDDTEQDNVISLVPQAKVEEKEEKPDTDEIFKRAKNEAVFIDVIVVGVDKDGNMGMITNFGNTADIVHSLEAAKLSLFRK